MCCCTSENLEVVARDSGFGPAGPPRNDNRILDHCTSAERPTLAGGRGTPGACGGFAGASCLGAGAGAGAGEPKPKKSRTFGPVDCTGACGGFFGACFCCGFGGTAATSGDAPDGAGAPAAGAAGSLDATGTSLLAG